MSVTVGEMTMPTLAYVPFIFPKQSTSSIETCFKMSQLTTYDFAYLFHVVLHCSYRNLSMSEKPLNLFQTPLPRFPSSRK